jgi:SAM-dependent methyltransferase
MTMRDPAPTRAPAPAAPGDVHAIWHDLECGAYGADLPLWESLAHRCGSPLLELGAGTGRVALHLARRGHRVTALEGDARLVPELRRRSESLPIEVIHADARSFQLNERFALCLAPMQIVQLLGGASGRARMLAAAARHLRTGGLMAIALTGDLVPFEVANGAPAPLPDACELEGTLYFSQPTAVYAEPSGHVLERRRQIVSPLGARSESVDRVLLDRLDARQLEREGSLCGLEPAGRMVVAATPEHAGSEVVMFRA